jgi:hypothetical protein
MIADNLDNSSLTSLSLTCRALSFLSRGSEHLNKDEKEKLLILLEKDIPTVYYCHECVKLHKWRNIWGLRLWYFYCKSLPCQGDLWKHSLYYPGPRFEYPLARLAMNRHFYGPSHGLPPERLQFHESYTMSKVYRSTSRSARIVDDNFLLLSVVTRSATDPSVLREHMETGGLQVCRHLDAYELPELSWSPHVPALWRDKRASDYFEPCNQSLGSCPFGMTDYSIDITAPRKHGKYVVKISVYSQLGHCRSPFDVTWRTLTTNDGTKWRVLSPERGPGTVIARWYKADGVCPKSESSWVFPEPKNYALA